MQTTKRVFAAALEERMKRQGVTQSQLSAISGVDQSVISRYIAAKVTPSLENALALIRGLNGVPVKPERSFIQALLGEHGVTLHAIIVSLAEADTKTIEAVAHLIGAKTHK
jgi:transcriptional regulator with XRE-family HTH domain